MTLSAAADFDTSNQSHLCAVLEEVKTVLRRRAELQQATSGTAVSTDSADPPETPPVAAANSPGEGRAGSQPFALEALCATFGLSPFERNVLLLCAGMELDAAFAPLCAAAQSDPSRRYPTFGLALAAWPDAHWSALTPFAPLRRWRLIEVAAGPTLTAAALRIDERILHYLAGVFQLDEQLVGLVEPLAAPLTGGLAPSQVDLARRIAAVWKDSRGRNAAPMVQLYGSSPDDRRAVAAAAASEVGLRAVALPASAIPAAAVELEAFVRLWEREAALAGSVLLVERDIDDAAVPGGDDARPPTSGFARFVALTGGLLIVSTREPQRIAFRSFLNFDVPLLTPQEQRAAWREALPPEAGASPTVLNAIASQFNLGLPAIRTAAREALARAGASPGRGLGEIAWQVCRARCRTGLDGIAQRIEPAAGWADLVLSDAQLQALRQIAVHCRHRATVYDTWGFAAKGARGLGISALFAGVSGTGKTLAAEVLAADLGLDLYRIDLASTVSKYIGETEKNLRRVFNAAEESGAILLFDEADALFGKRSEVKDSHDRYANLEVSYLLQRIEAYRGLVILTTNLKNALDPAFLRRLRFVVPFPFPDAALREELWRRVYPSTTPTSGLDASKLSKLTIAGGHIRNIALNAAFLAAEAGLPVGMNHVVAAAKTEYAKLERPWAENEMENWK